MLCDPSDSDLDPHGNLAKVDKEDVAAYYITTEIEASGRQDLLNGKFFQKLKPPRIIE